MNKKILQELYHRELKSVSDIAKVFRVSESKINYWFKIYKIQKRSISEAIYLRHNHGKDPFVAPNKIANKDMFIFGVGLGLYWGEGTKSSKHSVRLGNTDPRLVLKFLQFLSSIYKIDKQRLHFGLQIFNDCDPDESLEFWSKYLNVTKDKFHKIVVSKVRGSGTYKKKSKYGVLTIYFNNKKLRDIICAEIEKL